MSSRPHQASRRWTPFDGSIYRSDPHAELSKVGVIDVGSNSVRMVVFDGARDREQIIITEIPYQVNKAQLLERIGPWRGQEPQSPFCGR